MQKIQGNDVLAVDDNDNSSGNIIDLMEALQKSLEMTDTHKKAGNE